MPASQTAEQRPALGRRIAVAVGFGNFMEWFDFAPTRRGALWGNALAAMLPETRGIAIGTREEARFYARAAAGVRGRAA
jgi:hypothetical protein